MGVGDKITNEHKKLDRSVRVAVFFVFGSEYFLQYSFVKAEVVLIYLAIGTDFPPTSRFP